MTARIDLGKGPGTVPAILILGALTLALQGGALRGGWRYDDPMILKYIVEFPLSAFFFSLEESRSLWVLSFTPWLFLDYRLDYGFFGLEAAGFYAHNLVSIWAVAALTYVVLRPFAGRWWGLFAAALFLAGAPTAVVSQQLMSRHYAEGLLFAILAIHLHLHAEQGRSAWRTSLAAACYLIALLNKEIFLPLPLVLLLLLRGTWVQRLLTIAPLVLIAGVYVGWRAHMLGALVGGYTGGLDQGADIARSAVALPAVFFGSGWPAALGMALSAAVTVVLCVRVKRALPILLAAAFALALPFIAVAVSSDVLHFRYALLPWWAWCVLCALGLASVSRFVAQSHAPHGASLRARIIALVLPLMLALPPAWFGRTAAAAHERDAAEFDAQGAFLWQHDDRLSYVPSGNVATFASFQSALADVKKRLLGSATPVAIPFLESAPLFNVSAVWIYEPGCRCMKSAGTVVPHARAANASAYDAKMPMSVWLDRSGNGLRWNLSPQSANSACFLVFAERSLSLAAPCAGAIGYRVPHEVRGPFRFLARTENGAWGASPTLAFPEAGQTLQWQRE